MATKLFSFNVVIPRKTRVQDDPIEHASYMNKQKSNNELIGMLVVG